MRKSEKEMVGTIAAILTAVIAGFAVPLNKVFVADIDPIVFAGIRAIIVGVIFLAMSRIFHGKDLDIKQKGGIGKLPWKYLVIVGIIGGLLAFMFYFSGLQLTDANRAAFIQYTLPIWVTMFAYFLLKEYMHRKQILAMMLMLIGVFMILITPPNFNNFLLPITIGDLMVLVATILWALEAIIVKHAMLKNYHHFFISAGRMLFGGVLLFGAIIILGRLPFLLAIEPYQFVNTLISSVMLFGFVLFWYTSINYIKVSKAAALLLLAPVVSLIVSISMLGESAPPIQLAGLVFILIGAYFVTHIKSRVVTGV
jgi:drug/metabolite transporter (DMT)-like permease